METVSHEAERPVYYRKTMVNCDRHRGRHSWRVARRAPCL